MSKKYRFTLLIISVFMIGCTDPKGINHDTVVPHAQTETKLDTSDAMAGSASFEIIEADSKASSNSHDIEDAVYEYLYENVPEIAAFSLYLDEKSVGEVHLMSQVRSLPDKNSDNDIGRNYFIIYVGENHHDHIVNWIYFAVSQDLDDVLCMDIVNGEYISLEEWRISPLYPDYLTAYRYKDISVDNNKILKDYLQSPTAFERNYNLDELYKQGVSISDVSEQEFIKFNKRYDKEILPQIKLGCSIAEVKKFLGEPQFYDRALHYIGYRTEDCYFAIEGTDTVTSIVFTKNYTLPKGYESILVDFIDSGDLRMLADKYLGYSFRGQVARGGESLIYPFGIEFHSYNNEKVLIYTNFSGEIVDSDKITYTKRDSNEVRLRSHFLRDYSPETKADSVISPDGRKEAFSFTLSALYDYNKIYVYALDDSFAIRQFYPGYWIDTMEWLNNDVLLFCGMSTLGFYNMADDKVYYVLDLDGFQYFDTKILGVDKENQVIKCGYDKGEFLIRYHFNENSFLFDIEVIRGYPHRK